MKNRFRILALMVALLLFIPALPAPAESAATALPQVGDTVSGFTVKEVSRLDMADADLVLFEHEKTGALVLYIANSDTNRTFDISVRTPVTDSTGLPHVFEHATLDGSEKYPAQSLFFNLIYQTYNTYMNAGTYDIMTTYPVGSLSEAQLLKYADFYTDSVFHPLLMTDESIFSEEAWRYSLDSLDGALTIAGTVYSEMQGAYDLSSAALINEYRTLFPGAQLGNSSGGIPADIPDLTYGRLVEYHDLYYHPSNSLTCLYGKFDDYAAFLALLDAEFSQYEKRAFDFAESAYSPIEEAQTASFEYGVEAGSDTANGATVFYGIVCENPTEEEILELDLVTSVLNEESSPYVQGLRDALPAAEGNCYLENAGPEMAVIFMATGVNAGEEEAFRAVVDGALATAAADGYDVGVVDAVIASLDMDKLLTRESSSVGVDLSERIAYHWAAMGDLDAFAEPAAIGDAALEADALTALTAKYLVNNPRTALTITVPTPGLKEQQDQALADELASVKASMSEAELQAIVDATAALAEGGADDSSAYVAQLQAATVATLPEEVAQYPIADESGADGARRISAEADVEGVGQVSLLFSAEGLPEEDLHWFKLYADLAGMLDTQNYTASELAVRMTRYQYGGGYKTALIQDPEGEGFTPYLYAGWVARDEDLSASYDLAYEVLFQTKLDDAQAVLDVISSIRASLKQSFTDAPYQLQLTRAVAKTSPMYAYSLYLKGLDYYAFLADAEEMLNSDPEAGLAKLAQIQAYFRNRAGAVSAYSGSPESIAENRALADVFLEKLDQIPRARIAYPAPEIADSEALIVDSAVQYNLLYADFGTLGLPAGYTGDLDAVTALVSDAYLYPMLRDQYGAYGVIHYAMETGVYVISYRDPNIAETFAVYKELPAQIAQLAVDQPTLDGYIMSAYAAYAMPPGALSGANDAIFDALEGKGAQDKLEKMRSLKALTPEILASFADMYQALADKGVISTSGSASAVKANADLYKAILDPFAAQ